MAGYTVKTGALRAGGEDMQGLLDRCKTIQDDAVSALAAMAGNAGHPGVQAALAAMAGQGQDTFFGAFLAYLHISQALPSSAGHYDAAESASAADARAAGTRLLP